MHNQEEHIRGAVVILRPGGGGGALLNVGRGYSLPG